MNNISSEKSRARIQAKQKREAVHQLSAGPELIRHFPASKFQRKTIAGYWPLPGEMDIRSLMRALFETGTALCLPCTIRKGHPLVFRAWQPSDKMRLGQFSVREPYQDQAELTPDVILMPLLAFTGSGDRLGYGGGFYDRTLAKFRGEGDVFACGVAYAAQEAATLPTGEFDQKLDGILTEAGFKDFT